MTQVVLQIAVILLATWGGGRLSRLLSLPGVVGQIVAGMIVGPFALGGLAIPGFPEGMFPAIAGAIPVSPMLYTMSTLASIILLFISGLETDLSLFLRYAVKGGMIGVGGVVVSFVSGVSLTAWYFGVPITSPVALFLGTLSVATSIGITASLLSQKRKIDSPEGTVILAAAVIDDILGIIILAVVLGVAALDTRGSGGLGAVVWIAVRAIGIWAIATFIGIRYARPIGKFLKDTFPDRSILTVMALGMALLLSGLFELAGLSMIIGAYIMGLTLSNTDLTFLIQGKLKTLHDFFVPIFFAVSGMMVNFQALASWEVIGFGLLFLTVSVLAKLVGSGGVALGLNFTFTGAMRIGWGMVPRGEVALIIASIGVSSGILSESIFGAALIMTIGSTIIAPPILNKYLNSKKKGQRVENKTSEQTETVVNFQTPEFADLLVTRFLAEIEKEGFFVNRMEHEEQMYQLRKDDVFITLFLSSTGEARFVSSTDSIPLFQTALYESLIQVSDAAVELKNRIKPQDLAETANKAAAKAKTTFDIAPYLSPDLIKLRLESTTKDEIIQELIGLFGDEIIDREEVIRDVMERERSMSTGMQNGIAVPHAKTNGVKSMHVAIGIKPEGVDFNSLDGKPSTIFLLILSPKQGYGPHLQLLAALASTLNSEEKRAGVLGSETVYEVLRHI